MLVLGLLRALPWPLGPSDGQEWPRAGLESSLPNGIYHGGCVHTTDTSKHPGSGYLPAPPSRADSPPGPTDRIALLLQQAALPEAGHPWEEHSRRAQLSNQDLPLSFCATLDLMRRYFMFNEVAIRIKGDNAHRRFAHHLTHSSSPTVCCHCSILVSVTA